MTPRTLIILISALVIFSLLAILGQQEQQPANADAVVFLPTLKDSLDEINQMKLVGAGGEIIATLNRGMERWSIMERDNYPADSQKIRHTLLSLAEAKTLEAKTSNPEWHDRLGVEAIENSNANGISISLAGADTPVNIILGNTVGDSQAYIRQVDEPQSYLIDRDPGVGGSITDWLDTEVLAIARERIQRITVTHPDGEILTVFKEDAEQANFMVDSIPAGRELQYDSVANVIGNVLSNLNLQDVELRTDDDTPMTITEFRTFDGLVITAETIKREENAWVALRASYEPPSQLTGEEGPSTQETALGVEAEARELDQRLSNWRYHVATYQADQMSRRTNDLLSPLPDES
jgi:hypothetical protein